MSRSKLGIIHGHLMLNFFIHFYPFFHCINSQFVADLEILAESGTS